MREMLKAVADQDRHRPGRSAALAQGFQRIQRLDPSEYGGAPLLGVGVSASSDMDRRTIGRS